MSLDVFVAHVDEVYFVDEIHNYLLPLGLWGPEVKIQVPQQQRFTVRRALSPGSTKGIHPRCVSGGDVCTYNEESILPRDKLESQNVRGGDVHCFNQKTLIL